MTKDFSLPDSFKKWQADRQNKRLEAKLEKRNNDFAELKKEIISIIMNDDLDFETMTYECQEQIQKKGIILINSEIVSFVNVYFNHGHKTHERLTTADKFYQELDHTNSMIVKTDDKTVGLNYQ
jgi:hypothetical protein